VTGNIRRAPRSIVTGDSDGLPPPDRRTSAAARAAVVFPAPSIPSITMNEPLRAQRESPFLPPPPVMSSPWPGPPPPALPLSARVVAITGSQTRRRGSVDLLSGCQPPAGVHVTNPKTRPGRLQDVLPAALLDAFRGYIEALGQVEPAVLAADGLVYAPEIKYYAYRVPVDQTCRARHRGAVRDRQRSRYTASLSAAALTGIIAADAIAADTPAASSGQERARS